MSNQKIVTETALSAFASDVKNAIRAIPEPMQFKGTLGTGGTITSLPAASASNKGDMYKVITAGTYRGLVCVVGDEVASNGTTWLKSPSSTQLATLGDTVITTPSNADLLAYDSSTSKWVNTDLKGTASGSIATFSNGGNDIPVSEFECEIVAQQASGTPTPASPFPITGHSESDIVVCGKNLLDSSTLVQGGISGTGIDTVSNVRVRSGYFYLPSGDYIIKSDVYIDTINFYSSGDSSTFISRIIGSSSQISFTLTSGCYVRIAFRKSNTSAEITPNEVTNTQLEEGSTATTYEAYTGNLYTVSFGQTIYGGRLIYANGQWSIEATHGFYTFDGTQSDSDFSYSQDSETGKARIEWVGYRNVGKKGAYFIMSDKLNCVQSYAFLPDEWAVQNSGANVVRCFIGVPNTITSVADWQNFVSNNNISLVYLLETPVIIPITSSTRVKTIRGVNNIFSNTGDCELKYFTDKANNIAELIKAFVL